MNIITVMASDGEKFEFVDKVIGQGAMKDVYFSPDKKYVVGFYKNKVDSTAKERLELITGTYRKNIFNNIGGEYWENLFCWPLKTVEHKGRVGIVVPAYAAHFYFEFGSVNDDFLGIKGKEKEGKWFASASNQNRFLDKREKGNWLSYFKICLQISRAVRRLHMAGLAHSDLSYKNVLIDPAGGNSCIIDIDGLVVPNKFPPDVVGTPDFIAPEVMDTRDLPLRDEKGFINPKKNLPNINTDKHALAVLIYMYLLYRHPLRGGKVHDIDPQIDEMLSMGRAALFIEHPDDKSNFPDISGVKPSSLPWADPSKVPYTVCGPYLKQLFEDAFIKGLHEPSLRPAATQWETALIKTIDLVQPCSNAKCEQGWYVFENKTKAVCPFCKTPYLGELPVLNLYTNYGKGNFRPDNHRIMVYHNQHLFLWHTNKNIVPNERIMPHQKQPVGYFVKHNDRWFLVNQRLNSLEDLSSNSVIALGDAVELTDGKQILLSREEGGKLIHVQMANK